MVKRKPQPAKKPVKDIAADIGKSVNTVYKHIGASGIRPDAQGNYPADDVKKYIAQRQELDNANKLRPGSLKETFTAAKIKLLKLEIDEKEGRLESAEENRQNLAEAASMLKSALLGFGQEVAPVGAHKDEAELCEIIDRAMNRKLQDFVNALRIRDNS